MVACKKVASHPGSDVQALFEIRSHPWHRKHHLMLLILGLCLFISTLEPHLVTMDTQHFNRLEFLQHLEKQDPGVQMQPFAQFAA